MLFSGFVPECVCLIAAALAVNIVGAIRSGAFCVNCPCMMLTIQ